MATLPPGSDSAVEFPFHVTQSELRILKDLIAIAALRGNATAEWQNEDFLASRNITTAAACIESLKEALFPEETRLRRKRTEFLKPLNGSGARVHFDQSLESAALTLHAQINNRAEYESLVKRLQSFDYDEWQALCNSERVDAD